MGKDIYCQSCGTKIKRGSNFCEGCGELVEKEHIKYETERKRFSESFPDYPKRLLEIFIFLNIISIAYSIYINWGYFYHLGSLINLAITCGISLMNILFLVILHYGKSKYIFGLGITAFLSFILFLGWFVHVYIMIISIIEFLIFYIILFWLKHSPEEK